MYFPNAPHIIRTIVALKLRTNILKRFKMIPKLSVTEINDHVTYFPNVLHIIRTIVALKLRTNIL